MIKLPVHIELDWAVASRKKQLIPLSLRARHLVLTAGFCKAFLWFLVLRVYVLGLQVMPSRACTAEK